MSTSSARSLAAGASPSRDPNLDLIRATAIILVLIYHVVGMWPVTQPMIRQIAALGKHGVDLFFVLSGFLIGGLYFRELKERGHVNGLNFWLRRAVRTMPPYFVALALVYAAVRASRGDAFDPAYLWFGQNYEAELPFFSASWSLCVEEHAYVAMVVLLGALVAARARLGPFLLATCVSAAFMPWVDAVVRAQYGWAPRGQATHLWYGGLAMGVLASWARVFREPLWHRARSVCRRAWWLPVAVACCMSLAGKTWQPWVPFAMACGCAAVLVACADAAPLPGATAWLTRSIATISYSTYLTHGLMIHVGRLLRSRFPQAPDAVMVGVWLALIFGVATAFYWLVERSSIVVRDRLVPRPGSSAACRSAGSSREDAVDPRATVSEMSCERDASRSSNHALAVTLAVCGIFHYRKYVGELSDRGCLKDFFYSHMLRTTGRALGMRSGRAVNLWFKEYLYRGASRLLGGSPPGWTADLAHRVWDAGVRRRLRRCDIFHGMLHGTLLESFRHAQRMGIVTLGEPVNTHPLEVRDIVAQEHDALGLPPPRGESTSLAIVDELEACDYLLAGSRLIRDSYVARGFAAERAFVIPYAVDTTRFRPLTRDERAAAIDGRFRVVCVAQIVPRKGIHYLLEAWRRLGLSAAEGELVLIGQASPEMAGVLARYAGQFTHIPKVPHDRLRYEYGRADVFVLPSVEDGFGYVTTEAMGCGLPVITTSAAGSADVVEDGVTGFVVPPRSAEALADRIERLRGDPALRRIMAERNLAASQAHRTWSVYVDNLVALYGALAAKAADEPHRVMR